MTKIMPEAKEFVRYQWIKPVLEGYMSIKDVVRIAPFSERAIKYWLARYREGGMKALQDLSTRPHTHPGALPQAIRDHILLIRDEDRIGGKKIHWKLGKQGITISERVVNKILKQEGRTRGYRSKRIHIYKRTPITIPGKLVEIDIKYGIHFGFDRWWYQYTAIDVASRWRFLKGYDHRENDYSIDFLETLRMKTNHLFTIQAIKTDNDAVFTNRMTGYEKSTDPHHPRLHDFDIRCNQYGIIHYLIDPGKPSQNGHVERSHRSDKEYFYATLPRPGSIEEYNYKLRLWNAWYNDLPHCSLGGLSPNEYLEKVQNVRT